MGGLRANIFLLYQLMRIMIRASFVAASLRNSFSSEHHQRLAHWADVASGFCFDGVFAFRIIRA